MNELYSLFILEMNSNVNRHSRAAVLAPSNQDNYSVSSIKANVDSRKVDEEDALDVGEAFILPSASKVRFSFNF